MNIFEVIKCDEDFQDRLVWKHPSEDFNTKSQLIVGPSQEAVFCLNGEAVSFKPGKYTLDTGNIPFLRKIMQIPYGGESVFHCQVYFVNMVVALNLPWGTPSQFDALDPVMQVPLSVGASGSMGLHIDDAKKFILKLAGSNMQLTTDSLAVFFKDLIATRVKTYLSRAMQELSYLTINSYLDDFSSAMHMKIREDMLPYGILLDSFYIPTIMIPEECKAEVNRTQNELYRQGKLGYNWRDEQIAEIMKKYAENQGSQNNIGGMMAQTPVALAFGQMFSQSMSPVLGAMFSQPPKAFGDATAYTPPQPSSMFTPKTAPLSPLKPANETPVQQTQKVYLSKKELLMAMKEELAELKEMVDMGILTQEEFDTTKNQWLQKLNGI